MLLENLAYTEVEKYLKEKDIVLIPIGSIEQHSPYGLIGTDFIVAEAIARAVGETLKILVAPTVSYGVSPHHMAFKGTVSLNPNTMIGVVSDIVQSFVTHGFKRIIFVNGHGGNINPLKTAFQQIKADNIPGYFDVVSWYDSKEVRKICKGIFGNKEGLHATPSEVSIAKFLRSTEFKNKPADEQNIDRPKYYWPLYSNEMKKIFPDGRMSSAPWLATEKQGKLIMDKAAEALGKKIKEIMKLKIL